MKHLTTRQSLAALLASTLIWAGCQKEVSNQSNGTVVNQRVNTTPQGGITTDNPGLVRLVPMIMSPGAMGSSSTFKIVNIPATARVEIRSSKDLINYGNN